MALRINAREVPLRLGTGAFILNAGLAKLGKDDATAAHTHAFAAGAYPSLRKWDPALFVRDLSVSEIALGAMLLMPVVSTGLAGVGLTVLSACLLGLYLLAQRWHAAGGQLASHRPRYSDRKGRLATSDWAVVHH